MKSDEIEKTLSWLRLRCHNMSRKQRIQAANMLFDAAADVAMQVRLEVREGSATTNRRKAKRRETEVDPKPPLSPVSVAEPSKPKKPKYAGR